MIAKTIIVGVLAIAAGCTRAEQSETAPLSKKRIYGGLGFSFLPPPGSDWTEEFGKSQIQYSKKTDPSVVSFFAGALEIKLHGPLRDKEALAAFVREKKDEWGTDGRFTDVASSFAAEPLHSSCVRYRMTANDRGASNRGSHELLLLQTVGRFCTHPQNPNVAVDIFYSARHIPGYDANRLGTEGEAFVNSLAFHTPDEAKRGGK